MASGRMRPLAIVNPRSGGGRTGATFDRLEPAIHRHLGPFDVVRTERPRQATELAHRAAEDGRQVVIAVGGDGTIHEVASGLLRAKFETNISPLPKLGIIGQGTGGDFRRTLGIEHRLDRYCAAIAEGNSRRIDAGRIRHGDGTEKSRTTGYFLNILSAGIGGLVDRYVAEAGRALGPTLTYFTASLKGLLESEIGILECRIESDGAVREEEIRTRSIAICNGRYFGSGMHIAPMADPSDGVFDVVDLGGASRAAFAWVSSRVYTGGHVKHPQVRHFRCQRISMRLANSRAASKFLLDVDGEPVGGLPVDVELVPSALEVFAPEQARTRA